MAYESAACQQVKWAQASSEWIRFDTEEDDDEYGGAYPYGAGLNDHTIHYCYYTSKYITLHWYRLHITVYLSHNVVVLFVTK